LPHIIDTGAVGRLKYITVLKDAAKGVGGALPVQYMWSQGGDQFDLEEKLNLAFGYPALVGISLKKDVYVVHRGAFDVSSIRSFLSSLMAGSAPVSKLPPSLPPVKAADAWDGKDAPAEKDDDEIVTGKDEL
jgi:protein disulfide-isomerase A6